MSKDKPPKPQTEAERATLDAARHARFALARKLFDEVRAFRPPDHYVRATMPANRLGSPAIDLPENHTQDSQP